MNATLRNFAISRILMGLAILSNRQRDVFRLMYGRKNGNRSVEQCLATPMEIVANEIPDDKLDWALTQIEDTTASNAKK